MQHHALGDGRHVLRLDAGEELLGALRQFAEAQGVTAGLITGLGSVDAITLAFLDPTTNDYAKRRFEERMEVASLTGSLSMEEDRAHVHLHAVVSPQEFLAYAGHVVEAKVGATLEVYVSALPVKLRRVQVEGEPFPRLLLPGEPVPTAPAAAKPPAPAKAVARPAKKDRAGGR
jgi:predicted DNA-binding protein with PD1-like motif